MGVYSGHDFKAQCARCFSVTENPKMFIINSVINISLFVYTLLARGANNNDVMYGSLTLHKR